MTPAAADAHGYGSEDERRLAAEVDMIGADIARRDRLVYPFGQRYKGAIVSVGLIVPAVFISSIFRLGWEAFLALI